MRSRFAFQVYADDRAKLVKCGRIRYYQFIHLTMWYSMRVVILAAAILGVSACAVIDPLVYKINIPQGNFLEQRDVDSLRVGMTREQVRFVLGTPVIENSFREDDWVYVYRMKPGRGEVVKNEFRVHFENDLLADISGTYEKPADFEIPLAD